jgi:hypothetical protein
MAGLPERSFRLDAWNLDDLTPFVDLGLDDHGDLLRGAALGLNGGRMAVVIKTTTSATSGCGCPVAQAGSPAAKRNLAAFRRQIVPLVWLLWLKMVSLP